MAITYVAGNEGTPTGSLSSTSTVTKPAGLAVDDVMVAYTVSNLNGMTAPAGWTQVLSKDASTGDLFRVRVFYKVATSSDVAASNFVFSDTDSNSPCWAAIGAYRGVDTANPIDASDSAANTSTTSHTTPSVTTTHSSMILSHRAVRTSSGTTTFTSGVAHERFEGSNHSTVGYSAAMYDSGVETSAGSISGVAITAGTTSNITDSIVTTVALKTLNVVLNANAGSAAATVSGKSPTAALTESPNAGGPATATASAKTPVVAVGAVAGVATVAVSVKQVNVATTPFNNVAAGCAQVTASGQNTRMAYGSPGVANATVSTKSPLTSIGNQAGPVQSVGTAYKPSLGFSVSAGVAQVSIAAILAGPGLGSSIGVASMDARAYDASLYFGSTRFIPIAHEVRTAVVPSEDPRPFGTGEFNMTASPDFLKDPDDVLDYSFDWSDWLTTNELISSFVAIATPGITIDSTSNTATVTTTWLSGGVAGSPYTITHRIVTNQNRTVDRSMTIRVTSR